MLDLRRVCQNALVNYYSKRRQEFEKINRRITRQARIRIDLNLLAGD